MYHRRRKSQRDSGPEYQKNNQDKVGLFQINDDVASDFIKPNRPEYKQYGVYNDVHQPGRTLLNLPSFQNQNDIWYNNLGQNILDHTIKEYSLIIDSTDRDYVRYPNPFYYKIILKPIFDIKGLDVDGNEIPMRGVINRDFKNIKYIKLDTIVLPKKYKISENDEGEPELTGDLSDERFTILTIDEIQHNNEFSTNKPTTDSFSVLYRGVVLQSNFYYAYPRTSIRIYDKSELANLRSVTIRILDSRGRQLSPGNLDKKAKNNCSCHDEDDPECPVCTNVRHPLHPDLQNHVFLKVGVVENQQNVVTVNKH